MSMICFFVHILVITFKSCILCPEKLNGNFVLENIISLTVGTMMQFHKLPQNLKFTMTSFPDHPNPPCLLDIDIPGIFSN